MSTHILSVSEAQAKLHGGRCPFCGNKPKVGRRGDLYVFKGYCSHLWVGWADREPETILANSSSWQGPGWPYRSGLLVSVPQSGRREKA